MKKLNNYTTNQEIFVLLQWGKERSIIESADSHEVYLIENQYLMNLDERGVIY